jgi:hypothetical protein
MKMDTKRQATLLWATAAFAAVGSAAWFGPGAPAIEPVRAPLSTASYVPRMSETFETKREEWAAPDGQPAGTDWVYEVFSPPRMFYDRRTQRFTLAPSEGVREGGRAASEPASFGLVLLAVRPDLFRLQLIGFVGGEGDCRGVFENRDTQETMLATTGERFPKLGLAIDRFEVRRTPVPLPESMTVRRLVATAVVRDERTGESVALTDIAPRTTARLTATIACADESSRTLAVHEGDEITAAGSLYRIDKIQLTPPAIGVSRQSADEPQSDYRTLTLEPGESPSAPSSKSI